MQADEWLQHEISHLFGSSDNKDTDDVMDYDILRGGWWNWISDSWKIRRWSLTSQVQIAGKLYFPRRVIVSVV